MHQIAAWTFTIVGWFCLFLDGGDAWASELPPRSVCARRLVSKGHVIVVNPYSSGNALAAALKRRGYDPIAVFSTSRPLRAYQRSLKWDFPVAYFNVEGRGQLFDNQLSRYDDIVAVIAGAESAAPDTDYLNNRFELPGNDPKTTRFRTDKYWMPEALKAHGLDHIRQKNSGDLNKIFKFIRKDLGNRYPVVLKTRRSAGTEFFYRCDSEEDVRRAFYDMYGKKDKFGNVIRTVLVQEYLRGQEDSETLKKGIKESEYGMGTASVNGEMFMGEIWRYHKRLVDRPDGGKTYIYDYDELIELDRSNPTLAALEDYTAKALRAKSLLYGFGHPEVMMTDRGPVSVETGARRMGGNTEDVLFQAYGIDTLDIGLDSYLDHQAFLNFIRSDQYPLKKKAHVWIVQLICPHRARITSPVENWLNKAEYPAFYKAEMKAKVGSVMEQTLDLKTSAGVVKLVHENLHEVRRAYERLRWAELHGWYKFLDDPK